MLPKSLNDNRCTINEITLINHSKPQFVAGCNISNLTMGQNCKTIPKLKRKPTCE